MVCALYSSLSWYLVRGNQPKEGCVTQSPFSFVQKWSLPWPLTHCLSLGCSRALKCHLPIHRGKEWWHQVNERFKVLGLHGEGALTFFFKRENCISKTSYLIHESFPGYVSGTVIEIFHYTSSSPRKRFPKQLKDLWRRKRLFTCLCLVFPSTGEMSTVSIIATIYDHRLHSLKWHRCLGLEIQSWKNTESPH